MSTVQNVIDRVRRQLNDEDAAAYRWSLNELVAYVNDGMRQTVAIKPESNIVEVLFTPASTAPLQTLPANAVKFIKATTNAIGTVGAEVPGDPIRLCEKDVLDTFSPDWTRTDPAGDVPAGGRYSHYMHDKRDPTRFYLYPRPSVAAKLWLEYAALPNEVTALVDDFPLSDQYLDAVVQYVLYRALTKDGRYSQGPDTKRQQLWQAYIQALGLSRQVTQSVTPEEHKP